MGTERFNSQQAAVVTGAARGIGLGIAERLARQGVRVALFDRDADALVQAAATLRATGASVHTEAC